MLTKIGWAGIITVVSNENIELTKDKTSCPRLKIAGLRLPTQFLEF